jgi:small subunit ribosomal protein S21
MAKQFNNAGKKGITGNTVYVGEMPIAVALRKFKKKVEESGVLEAVRAKEFYEKPTTARKKAKGAAKARWKKKLRNEQLPPKLY